jgi:hypothetical protein
VNIRLMLRRLAQNRRTRKGQDSSEEA